MVGKEKVRDVEISPLDLDILDRISRKEHYLASLAKEMNLTSPRILYNIEKLEKIGLLARVKDGRRRFYVSNPAVVFCSNGITVIKSDPPLILHCKYWQTCMAKGTPNCFGTENCELYKEKKKWFDMVLKK